MDRVKTSRDSSLTPPRRWTLGFLAIAAAAISTPGPAGAGEPNDGERISAIRALYGVGLSIQNSGDSITIDWGELDAATYQRYVTRYYLPELEGWFFNLHVRTQVAFADTYDSKKKKAAHILAEPLEKLALCEGVAKRIGDRQRAGAMQDFCREQALRHALAPVVAFRGERVSYTKPSKFAGMTLKEELYAGRDGARQVLITVPGPGEVATDGPLRVVPWIANSLRYDAPAKLKQLAREAKQRAEAELKIAEKRIAARDKKVARSRGSVVFTDYRVEGWEPIRSLGKKARPDCYDTFMHIYGPKQRGYYDLTIRANGTLCKNDVNSGKFVKHLAVYGVCPDYIKSGENEISVVISKNINKVTGKRLRVRRGKIRKEKLYSNKAGKALVSSKLTCTF